MVVESHLILQELTLRPAEEWTTPRRGWFVARVAEGVGYWMQDGNARELNVGDCFVVSFNANAYLRVSQLSLLKLQFFTVQPEHLKGLLTVTEWHHLEYAPDQSAMRAFVFGATELIGKKFARLAAQTHSDGLVMRCALLHLWTGAVAGLVSKPAANTGGNKLRERLCRLLGQIPEIELSQYSLSELAAQLKCSRRHLTRLFRNEFGVQFALRYKGIYPMQSRSNSGETDANNRHGQTPVIAWPQNFDNETSVKSRPGDGVVAGAEVKAN